MFYVFDCCFVIDVGGVYVLILVERVKDFQKKLVYIFGIGEGVGYCWINQMLDFTVVMGTTIFGL